MRQYKVVFVEGVFHLDGYNFLGADVDIDGKVTNLIFERQEPQGEKNTSDTVKTAAATIRYGADPADDLPF